MTVSLHGLKDVSRNMWQAMMAALRRKEYTLKQYLVFADKLQEKAKVIILYFLFYHIF